MNEPIEICTMKDCTACGACVQVCPISCITMVEDLDGFSYPKIDYQRCLKCLKCVKTCHNNKTIKKHEASFFMGWHKNVDVLKNSSSGGAFTALADIVLSKGGIVFGAAFDEKTRKVKHIAIERREELDKIRLSKYYQGSIEDCYIKAKEAVQSRWVLFSGTACQIAGLYSFLDSDYENLITVDVLCHGMASHKVVDEYIKSKEKRYKKKIVNFKFRLKPNDSDWLNGGGTRMKLYFMDGSYSIESQEYDTYFVGFNNYLFLRESCYTCKYTGTNRIADFTLADYWGVPLDQITDRERKYGVSLILANSDKAKSFLSDFKNDMIIQEIEPSNAISHNQALEKPSTVNSNRDKFFKQLGRCGFDWLIYKYNWKYYTKLNIRSFLIKVIGKKMYQKISKQIKRFLKK